MFYNVYFADLKRRVCQCFGGAGAGLLVFSVECINDKTIKCVCNTCEQWRSMLRTAAREDTGDTRKRPGWNVLFCREPWHPNTPSTEPWTLAMRGVTFIWFYFGGSVIVHPGHRSHGPSTASRLSMRHWESACGWDCTNGDIEDVTFSTGVKRDEGEDDVLSEGGRSILPNDGQGSSLVIGA